MTTAALIRHTFTDKSTIGDLYIAGAKVCNVLEDTCRAQGVKVPGQTAIPPGTYKLVINWSERYGRLMPRLLNVPNFDGILIHWGNTDVDTKGCLLVGVYDPAKPDFIGQSRQTFETVFGKLSKLSEFGPMTISISGGRELEAVA